MKDIVAESEADYIRRSAGGGFKKAKATDRRSRLHAALDYAMNYGTPPKIRKTLSILNPADLAKMTGSSEPQYIGKGKPYTGFAKDSMGVCPVCKTQAPVVRGVFARHWVDGAVCSGSGSTQAKDETPQEKARRKLSPDQAARLKELLAKVKPAPSAAAPMPRAKATDYNLEPADCEANIHYYEEQIKSTERRRKERGDEETNADLRFFREQLAMEKKNLERLKRGEKVTARDVASV
jgi:hypothetical protein